MEQGDDASTCVAQQRQPPPVSLREFFASLGGPRCGKPATRRTVMGPMCDECYESIEASRKAGTNLLGVLQQALGRSDASREGKDPARSGEQSQDKAE